MNFLLDLKAKLILGAIAAVGAVALLWKTYTDGKQDGAAEVSTESKDRLLNDIVLKEEVKKEVATELAGETREERIQNL